MSNVIDATCSLGVVRVGALPVESATIFSEGKGASTGVLLIDEDRAKYLTSSASDIKDLITTLGDILDKIITIASGLDAVTVSPGTQAANIVLLSAAKTQLLATKETLK